MGLTSSIQNVESPHFYFELGELIANAGHDRFAENMLHLVDKLVPINRVELTEWTLDERQASILDIKHLGSAGLWADICFTELSHRQDDHPLFKNIIEMDD